MDQWTHAARRMLDDCLNRNRRRFAAEGAEADEVAADLRRHLEFEAREERLKVVTEADVRRILAKVDPKLIETADARPLEPSPPPEPSVEPPADKPEIGDWGRATLWLFGVLLPLGTLVAEFFLRMCAAELFDPLPTWLHVGFVASVPLVNAAVLLCLNRRGEAPPVWLWWAHSFALGVAGCYAVLFLPLTPFAVFGLVFFGFGFLPLAPLLSWICGLVLATKLRGRAQACGVCPPEKRWLGWVTAAVLLVLPSLPAVLAHHWLHVAANGTEAERTAAIRQLRRFGREEDVLRAAYGQFRRGLQEFGWGPPCNALQAQETYFRVAGRAFNAVPPPQTVGREASRMVRDEFEWDEALGGETVAGQVSGLSLLSSRLDASAHATDGWGYTEWTMEFRNDHPRRQREARAVLQLPPGGVVSRVTLWVNGEEREAAFGGRSAVRAAYQQVAVVERRDPILVTTAGPDRVLVQCFPIPTKGGVMKIRLGITAPLEPLTAGNRAFLWPRLVEHNFAVHDEVLHQAWLELVSGRTEPATGWQRDAGRPNTLHAAIPERNVNERLRSARLETDGIATEAWALDDREPKPAWVRQRLETSTAKAQGRLAVVLDGGRGAGAWIAATQQALAQASGHGEVAIWVAYDGASLVFLGADASFADAAKALARWKQPFEGGHDPGPALEAALDWAGAVPGGKVLWVHGPQAVAGRDAGALRQRLERSQEGADLVDVVAADGPNRLAETLDGVPHVSFLARVGTPAGDLGRFLDQWSGLAPAFRWISERTENPPSAGVSASRHLVRLWAVEAVEKLRAERRRDDAVNLAARWQLVTAVSGAVVLETAEQFARHGLSPVDPLTTPMVVPEPESWALLGLGLGVVTWWTRRARRAS